MPLDILCVLTSTFNFLTLFRGSLLSLYQFCTRWSLLGPLADAFMVTIYLCQMRLWGMHMVTTRSQPILVTIIHSLKPTKFHAFKNNMDVNCAESWQKKKKSSTLFFAYSSSREAMLKLYTCAQENAKLYKLVHTALLGIGVSAGSTRQQWLKTVVFVHSTAHRQGHCYLESFYDTFLSYMRQQWCVNIRQAYGQKHETSDSTQCPETYFKNMLEIGVVSVKTPSFPAPYKCLLMALDSKTKRPRLEGAYNASNQSTTSISRPLKLSVHKIYLHNCDVTTVFKYVLCSKCKKKNTKHIHHLQFWR